LSTVFIGGSRKISRLPQGIEQRLDTIMSNGFHVIVGDATGADKAVQKYLLNAAYDKVTVFCSGHSCRNNLGEWQAKLVTAGKEKGFQFYAAKDREMARVADFGLMIWDGESPGTLLNILRLIQAGKKAVLVDAPHKDTFNFTTSKDWQGFINRCDLQLVDSLRDRAVGDELRLLSEPAQTNWLDDTPHIAVSDSATDDASNTAGEIDAPSRPPISIELAAKASLEVKAEIPKESMGRTLDALVDMIRPFTEARGLRADQLRLQRHEVAYEIAQIAKKTAELDGLALSPPPVKFLVPFLERASLEDTDTELHSRWAALLVSASRNYEARHLTYIDILSRLSSDEISILEEVCVKDARFPQTWHPDSHLQQNRRIAEKAALKFNVRDASTLKSQSIFLQLVEDQPFTYGRIMNAITGGLANLEAFYSEFGKPTDTRYKSLEILERERLIEFGRAKPSGAAAEVSWFSVSNLGLDFAKDCSPSARRD
jgi:Abortive infection alpha